MKNIAELSISDKHLTSSQLIEYIESLITISNVAVEPGETETWSAIRFNYKKERYRVSMFFGYSFFGHEVTLVEHCVYPVLRGDEYAMKLNELLVYGTPVCTRQDFEGCPDVPGQED